MHRLYFLFARGLTPPLFRIECQLEGLTRYTHLICVVVNKERTDKRISIEQYNAIVSMHRDFDREKRDASSRIERRKSKSEPDRADSRRRDAREKNLFII